MISPWLAGIVAGAFLLTSAFAERVLSDQATATLWTVGPGPDLYAAFGHTALRIADPVIGFDRIYNFGTFDFRTPNFYLKFIRGDLDYFLTAAIAPEVMVEYRTNHQLVIEQELNLTPAELDGLFLAMEDNLQPERAAYRYDFIRDNCTTRIRDAIARVTPVRWKPLHANAPTLREMIQPYVADRPAIRLGINFLFGSNMDHSATSEEAMFLPEDLKRAFNDAIITDATGVRPLVRTTRALLDGPKLPVPGTDWLSLGIWIVAVAAVVSLVVNRPWPHPLDVALFCMVALAGCFVWFLWLGTRHWVLHQNWHLLWAWPTHLVIWFFPKRIQRKYWALYAAAVLLGGPWFYLSEARKWTAHAEQFPFLALKLLLGARALALFRRLKTSTTSDSFAQA